jgi:hypothetical protein
LPLPATREGVNLSIQCDRCGVVPRLSQRGEPLPAIRRRIVAQQRARRASPADDVNVIPQDNCRPGNARFRHPRQLLPFVGHRIERPGGVGRFVTRCAISTTEDIDQPLVCNCHVVVAAVRQRRQDVPGIQCGIVTLECGFPSKAAGDVDLPIQERSGHLGARGKHVCVLAPSGFWQGRTGS